MILVQRVNPNPCCADGRSSSDSSSSSQGSDSSSSSQGSSSAEEEETINSVAPTVTTTQPRGVKRAMVDREADEDYSA